MEALVRYFHADAGFPVSSTWLKSIKAGKFSSWPELTYQNAAKYYPIDDENLKGYMTQLLQVVLSTNTKPSKVKFNTTPQSTDIPSDMTPSNEMYIRVEHTIKVYTDDTGRFPVRSHSGNQYIMIAYHCDSNAIIASPFKSRTDKHILLAYNTIMQRLEDRNILVDLQLLDNEASAEYKHIAKSECVVEYQFVPPNIHSRNAAEH